MLKNFNKMFLNPIFLSVLTLISLLFFSLHLRQAEFNKTQGAENLEATYHVLLTINALNESPAKNHWYLPAVSLGTQLDKHTPWGATIPTKTGDYIYTSFPSVGFLAPYLWFKIFGLEVSIKNLAYFNFFLQFFSILILFSFLVDLLRLNKCSSFVSAGGALIGALIGIFSREAFQSYGIIYWCQSFYQLILISSLYALFKYWVSETKHKQLSYAIVIAIMAFLGPFVEWTGFVFNVGLASVLLLNSQKSILSKKLAIWVLIATISAGVLIVFHFSLAAGFDQTISALINRFFGRSIEAGCILCLVYGYIHSYGFFLAPMLLILAFPYFSKTLEATKKNKQITLLIIVAASVPLLENIVMLQHALQFTFDRLKFIFPASIILAFLFACFNAKGRVILVFFVLFSSFFGYKAYKNDLSEYSSWAMIDLKNRQLAARIIGKVDRDCTVFISNVIVRGYANLLFHRAIYEKKSAQDAFRLIKERNACSSVYLESKLVFTDMPQYTKAIITYKNGSTIVLE